MCALIIIYHLIYLYNFSNTNSSRRKIITRTQRLLVVAGTPNRLVRHKKTLEMKVLQVVPHKKYVPEGAHDIALLRLASSFPDDNDLIKVIPLRDEIIPNGTECRIIGWGQLFYVCTLSFCITTK